MALEVWLFKACTALFLIRCLPSDTTCQKHPHTSILEIQSQCYCKLMMIEQRQLLSVYLGVLKTIQAAEVAELRYKHKTYWHTSHNHPRKPSYLCSGPFSVVWVATKEHWWEESSIQIQLSTEQSQTWSPAYLPEFRVFLLSNSNDDAMTVHSFFRDRLMSLLGQHRCSELALGSKKVPYLCREYDDSMALAKISLMTYL